MQAKLAISQDKAGYELANGLKGKEKLPPSDSFLSSLFFSFLHVFSLSRESREPISTTVAISSPSPGKSL